MDNLNRRDFMRTLGLSAAVGLTVATAGCSLQQDATLAGGRIRDARALNMRLGAKQLAVQPVLMYDVSHRRERRSWRNWGGVQTEEAAKKEAARISQELNELCGSADFGVRALPLAMVANKQQVGPTRISRIARIF